MHGWADPVYLTSSHTIVFAYPLVSDRSAWLPSRSPVVDVTLETESVVTVDVSLLHHSCEDVVGKRHA